MKILRKYHKWISIIFSLFFISFGLSGIILNHREWLAPIEVSRSYLPQNYRYHNWNNAAIRGTLRTHEGKILLYGNIGIWETSPQASYFKDLNHGIKKGIDNRKTSAVLEWKGKLIAGTFSGLYLWDSITKQWIYRLPELKNNWIMDITTQGDSLFILTRSELLSTADLQKFHRRFLPPPEGYDNRADLFKTLWVIHSGEIYGTPGKILVDLLGIALVFLTITGLKIFIDKIVLKKTTNTSTKRRKKYWISWNLKWHNKIGYIAIAFLLVNSITGIFLRPPFLILAAGQRVKKIPLTELDSPNPWFDQLRRIHYDTINHMWVVSTYDGFYYSEDDFHSPLKRFIHQPPVSVMGVNVLKQMDSTRYLVGSFEGLFLWDFLTGECLNFITGKPYTPPKGQGGAPIGDYLVTGYSGDFPGHFYVFDYNQGCFDLAGKQALFEMPAIIVKKSPMSLWSLALEFHTGRIFQPLIGPFYILIVPLTGLAAVFVLVSGFWVWWKFYRRRANIIQGTAAFTTIEEGPSPASLKAEMEKK